LGEGDAVNVIDIRGITVDALVGPQHGATRIYIWCVTVERGQVIGLHHHHGEELFRVLYGGLRFRVGDEVRDIRAGEVVIIPPGTVHAYMALEDTELEIYGEIGSGEFFHIIEPDGTVREEEIFVRGHPWSRTPPDERQFSTQEELFQRYRTWYAQNPFSRE
jgi:quercetin dioxygenase-like cupin family protein